MIAATCFIPTTTTLLHSHHTIRHLTPHRLPPNPLCPPRRRSKLHSSFPTASTSSQSTPTPTPTTSPLSLLRTFLTTTLSLGALLSVQYLVSLRLAAHSLSFPAPLAAMLLFFSLISLLRFFNFSPTVDKSITTLFTPGVTFLTRWLSVFFVPNLVMLPLAPPLPSADLPKILSILIFGFCFTLLSSALVCTILRSVVRKLSGKLPQKVVVPKVVITPPSNTLITTLACITVLTFAMATASRSVSIIPARIYALSATLLTFTAGQRSPKSIKRLLHPLVSSTVGTIALMALLGTTTGLGYKAALGAYYVRGAAPWAGGGNMLAALLGPAVITFAFTMDKQRRLARSRIVEVAGTSLFATIAALFGTAMAGRLLRLSGAGRLLVIPRTITAPLAVAIAEMLGAHVGLAASVVGLTGLLGANVAAGILSAIGVKDPVVRGLSVGSSAHGLGTAAISDEAAAFPFAALAMTLVGLFSTVLVAYGPFRGLLLRVAMGTVVGMSR